MFKISLESAPIAGEYFLEISSTQLSQDTAVALAVPHGTLEAGDEVHIIFFVKALSLIFFFKVKSVQV